MCAIFPNSVSIPVLTTTASPWPWLMTVPMKTILWRSPMLCCLLTIFVSFRIGLLSPVRLASMVFSCAVLMRRASAGMCIPSSSTMMSPGTSSRASI